MNFMTFMTSGRQAGKTTAYHRELDKLIAEKVMGVSWCQLMKEGSATKETGPRKCQCGAIGYPFEHHAPYSTNVAAAWEVVEKLKLLQHFSLEQNTNGKYEIVEYAGGYDNYATVIAEGKTAPHVICLAALKIFIN